jgi:hypothetical protein
MSDANPRRLRPRRQAPEQSEPPPSDNESVHYSDDDHEDADRIFRQEPARQQDPLHFPAPEATGVDNSQANRRPILNIDRSNRSDVHNLSPIRESVPLQSPEREMPHEENTVGTYPHRQFRPRESPEQEKAIAHLKRAKEAIRKLRDDFKFEALKGKSNYRHWADNMEQLFDDNAVTPIVYGEVMILPREHRHFLAQAQFVSFARRAINSHVSKQIQQYLQDRKLRDPAAMWRVIESAYAPTDTSIAANGVDELDEILESNCTSLDQYKFRFQTAWTKTFIGSTDSERVKCLFFLKKLDSPKWDAWKTSLASRVSRSSDADRIYQFDELIAELEDFERSLDRETKTRSAYAVRSAAPAALAAASETRPQCDHCKKKGHVKANCWKLRRERKSEKEMKGDGFSAEKTESYTANTVEILLPQNILSTAIDTPSDRWICDTGADVHFTASPSNFIPGTARTVSIRIQTVSGTTIEEGLRGDVSMKLSGSRRRQDSNIVLTDVTWTPTASVNLISGARLAKKGVTAIYRPDQLLLKRKDGSILGTGRKVDKQWILNVSSVGSPKMETASMHNVRSSADSSNTPAAILTTDANADADASQPRLNKSRVNVNTWHRRMGHIGTQGVQKTARIVDGIDIEGLAVSKRPCGDCAIGRAPHKPSRRPILHRSERAGDLVYIDIGGGGKLVPAIETGARYWLLMIDDFDGWAEIRFLRTKSEAETVIKELVSTYEKDRQYQIKDLITPKARDEIGAIQTDNGREFTF